MRPLDVIIQKGGKTAMEINPLGKEPDIKGGVDTQKRYNSMDRYEEWKQAEKKRRVFEIDFTKTFEFFHALEKAVGGKIHHAHFGYKTGSYHKAQLLHNCKLRIIKSL